MMYVRNSLIVALLIGFTCWLNAKGGEALGTFGFDIHHRYSDTVKQYLGVDGLPEKDTLDYYTAMAQRDKLLNARRLAGTPFPTDGLLTFFGSNQTVQLNYLGYLHYGFVGVGTPMLPYVVALDTGSNLFWLPCDCASCVRRINTTSGRPLDFNVYSPRTSSTSAIVACNSTKCGQGRVCLDRFNACAYQEVYLSANASTSGILVDDVLYLGTESTLQDEVQLPVTLGCGMVQTGDFVTTTNAINGLFGLGMDNISVPSVLANKGFTANSFSMCFQLDGLGRIEFGDKGSADQRVTPFNLGSTHSTYNITVTQIAVENNITDLECTAIFDSGSSFTYLNDPAYSFIAENFNSQITNEPRYQPQQKITFEYCYALGATQPNHNVPSLNFTMQGGEQYFVQIPTTVIPRQGGHAYCLAIIKSEDVNIIGQNFMAGYRIVFDREEMVLGWEENDCSTPTSTTDGGNTLPIDNSKSTGAPPPAFSPAVPRVPPPPSAALNSKANVLVRLMLSLCIFYQFMNLSS